MADLIRFPRPVEPMPRRRDVDQSPRVTARAGRIGRRVLRYLGIALRRLGDRLVDAGTDPEDWSRF